MTLGKRIRMVRGDRTIANFVESYGICPNTLMNYESDRRKPDAIDVPSRLVLIENKLDELIRKLSLIFGDCVLVDGKFISVK